MADPKAEYVLTARDATGAAVKSAERGLKSMISTARAARTAFASIGVGLSVRAFASWISGAMDVNKLTAAQIEETKAARQAFAEFKGQSDELARGLADVLTPAVNNLAISMGLLRKTFLPTEQEKFNDQLDLTRKKIDNLLAEIDAAEARRGRKFLGFLPVKGVDSSIANMRKELEALTAEWQSLLRQQDVADGTNSLPTITQDELINLELFIHELNSIKPVKPIEMLTQDELVRLEEFIYYLNHLPQPEPIAMITQDELVALEEFIYELNHGADAIADMNEEAKTLAESLGRGLRDSLVDFLVDGELRFKDFIKRLAAEFLTSQLFGALSKAVGNPFLSALFGGARAEGGPVTSGRAYLVGERGPEMFIPGASGAIAPRVAMAGGDVYVTNHNTYYGTPPADAARHQAETVRRIRADLKNERERGRS